MSFVQAGSLQLAVTPNPAQTAASGGGDSLNPVISPDGRYVLFSSSANNLVSNTNGVAFQSLSPAPLNVFLRDRTNGVTRLVSVNLAGTGGGNGNSIAIALSTNGQYALFESIATNLVAGDSNNVSDVFVRDLVNNTTTLVSVSTNGGCANRVSYSSTITPDGRYVAFVSAATNLVAGDDNQIPDIFVRDLQGATTTLVSVGARNNASGGSFTNSSESPDISTDGRYVVFYSTATKLVPGSTASSEIYVRDLLNGTTTMASAAAHDILLSAFGSTNTVAYNHTISEDGQYIAYQASDASSVSPGVVLRYNISSGLTDIVNTNAVGSKPSYATEYRSLDMTPDGRFIAFVGQIDSSNNAVYVWDAQTATTTLASGDLNNAVSGASDCYWPQISADGNMVSFFSNATNLVANGITGDHHLYVRNLLAGTTTLADVRADGGVPGFRPTDAATLSSDGRFIAFESYDSNLVSNDFNRAYDVFFRDLSTNTVELISARLPALPSLSPNSSSTSAGFSASADARFIAFSSDADNLGPNNANGYRNVFVHDKLSGSNILVSMAADGSGPGSSLSFEPAISANGRYVAFTSSASNLVALTDANNSQDVFVRDLQSGTNILVSFNTAGTGPGNTNSYSPTISSDGRYVLFRSKAGNLVPGITTTTIENLYMRDLQTATTRALLTNSANTSLTTTMTPDGRYVAYNANAVPNNTIYVWDLQAARRIYTNGPFFGTFFGFALSPDDKHLVYANAVVSGAASYQIVAVDLVVLTNLTLSTQPVRYGSLQFSANSLLLAYNSATAVNLYDFQHGTNFVVTDVNVTADFATISPDGRFIAYRNTTTNIVASDSNGVPDIALYDHLANTTTFISASIYGNFTGNNRSFTPVFSGDSETLLFQSWASDLVAGDFNQGGDLFAYDPYAFRFSIALSSPGNLAWPVIAGKNYQVLYKNRLTDPVWQPISGTYQTNGGQGFWSDPAPPTNRFYRVVAY